MREAGCRGQTRGRTTRRKESRGDCRDLISDTITQKAPSPMEEEELLDSAYAIFKFFIYLELVFPSMI